MVELEGIDDKEDLQVFTLQQRALGETLIEGQGDDAHCMRFATFCDRWVHDDFRSKFEPLEKFVSGLTPHNARRWRRLEVMLAAVGELGEECSRILAPSGRVISGVDDGG